MKMPKEWQGENTMDCIKVNNEFIIRCEEQLGFRYTASLDETNKANKIAFEGFTEALRSLGFEWMIDRKTGEARIWHTNEY
jgi:hypothetical protein